MTVFPWEAYTLYVAVDPAQRRSAVAYSGYDGEGRRVKGLTSVNDISLACRLQEWVWSQAEGLPHTRVVLAVEYPRWNVGAAQTVRAAANVYVRLLSALWPRRTEVRKVDPNSWQAAHGFRSRAPGTTKEYSRLLAGAMGWDASSHDEADAALILEHARRTPPTGGQARRKS